MGPGTARRPRPATIVLAALLVVGVSGCTPGIDASDQRTPVPLTLATYGLFDLGVTDADGDGRLDLFTSTHSGPQSVALNQGALVFEDAFARWRLDQDPRFPGMAVLATEPRADAPGLYVNWRGPDLLLRAQGLRGRRVAGTVDALTAFEIVASDGFESSATREPIAPRVARGSVSWSLAASDGDGLLVFRPEQHAQPIAFTIEGVTPADIRVGPGFVHPDDTAFDVFLRDRHGMAWADYDDDGQPDVFITRGGLQGTMKYTPRHFADELFVRERDGMRDIGDAVGLHKRGCPGREAGWTDFDADGRLDLYVVCGRDGGGEPFGNQLFRQIEGGGFVDVAADVGLALSGEGKFLWIDLDGDGLPGLLWAGREGIFRFMQVDGRFRGERLATLDGRSAPLGFRLGDVDGDGIDDVFLASPTDSRVLLRRGSTFAVRDPAEFGLPSRNLDAGFADLDNDGTEELISIPHGVHRRGADGRFTPTGALRWRTSWLALGELKAAHIALADLSGDGTQQLLLAANVVNRPGWRGRMAAALGHDEPDRGPLRGRWSVSVAPNPAHGNHWLQVDLAGPPGNAPGLGARILLESAAGLRVREVGHAETSHYSRGHYRAYFGLGQDDAPAKLEVHWPDGARQVIERPGVDRRITVRRAEAPAA